MWLRLYTDVRDDPKVQRLPDATFKHWINLLCLAKEHGGLIPPLEDVAYKLKMADADAKRLVEELVERKLLDRTDEGLSPHNWENRQFLSDDDPTAAIRARRYRTRNVTRNVTRDATGDVTGDVTDYVTDASRPPDTETDTEQSRAEQRQSRGGSGETPSPAASRAGRARPRRPVQCDEEFLEELQQNPAYAAFDVKALFHKMAAWCKNKGKQPTRGRFINWLNREDKPMMAQFSPPKDAAAHVGKSTLEPELGPEETEAGMAEYIENLIALGDLVHIGHARDAIVKRGGPKAKWEHRVIEYLNNYQRGENANTSVRSRSEAGDYGAGSQAGDPAEGLQARH